MAKLVVPRQDLEVRSLSTDTPPHVLSKGSAHQFFRIWDRLKEKNVLEVDESAQDCGISVFTISDLDFGAMVPQDIANPFDLDVGLQRLVLATQLVARNVLPIDFEDKAVVKTAGRRTLQLARSEHGELTVNGVRVVKAFHGKKSSVYLLEKVLWIRPEDVSSAIGNLEKATDF